jgi:hypothetical protein
MNVLLYTLFQILSSVLYKASFLTSAYKCLNVAIFSPGFVLFRLTQHKGGISHDVKGPDV